VTTFLRTTLTALCILLLSQSAQADEDLDKLKQKVQKRVPEISITDIKPAPIPGLYEIVFGTRVAYVSADGQFILMGDLVNLDSQRNLTAMRRGSLVLKSIDAMGEASMIVLGPAQPKRTLTVFTDVDCPYCARLHNEVPALSQAGVKVRYLLYPRAGKDSKPTSVRWRFACAKDRVKAIALPSVAGNWR
jgi:thiol:disulfide interchange protein DsbC